MKILALLNSKFRRFVFFCFAALLFVFFATPLPSPLFPDDYSTVVLGEKLLPSDENVMLRTFLNEREQWHLPPDPKATIPKKLEKAVLFYEDKYFFYHPGVNPAAILRAISQNLQSKNRVSGASTLTMQVARLAKPKARTYLNKTTELIHALKIELYFSKREILNFYLNHAPYGGNVVGYRAAGLRYFSKLPEELSWAEAATLAVLPNAPGIISPQSDPTLLLEKRNRLLKRMRDENVITDEIYQISILEPSPEYSKSFPFLAPHLAQKLHSKSKLSGGIIQTTLSPTLQKNAAQLLAQQIRYLSHQDIKNGAAVIAETKTGKVRAYIGSQDFFDQHNQGQVDGVSGARSSGSTLKPFLFALGIDAGTLLPQTLLTDIPTFYGTFSPRNATEQFSGVVTAENALIRSLNVPAVRLLYTFDVLPFYTFLKSTGISTLFRQSNEYGLTLIIGGSEVNLLELTALYSALGNMGNFNSLSVLSDGSDQKEFGSTFVSKGAIYQTLQMLRNVKRPDAEFYWEVFQDSYPVAWKTGTSYGQRDAWAVGVSPEWTVGVWVGNFDGEGNANLSGAKSAGPLLFDLFNMLPKNPDAFWFEKPEADLKFIEICKETGFLKNRNCPNGAEVEAPKFAKPLKLCPYHFNTFVSKTSGKQVCSQCWENGDYISHTPLIFPAEIVQFARMRGQILGEVLSHNPNCPTLTGESPLTIIYPQENAKIRIPKDFDERLQKLTIKLAHREKQQQIFWYLNDQYLGITENRHEKAVDCQFGWNTLEVVDENGFRQKCRFWVDIKE